MSGSGEDQDREHAKWSPSSAHRWRHCHASVKAEEGFEDTAGIEAAQGTIFHEHAELALTTGIDPKHLPTGVVNVIDGHEVSYDSEMIENMYGGLAYIQEIMDAHDDAILLVEQKVNISAYTGENDGFGTSDVIIIIPSRKRIIVFDWKYGMVSVAAENNDQGALYALGAWETHGWKHFDSPKDVTVEIVIWQPRVPGGGGRWQLPLKKLLAIGREIRADADATRAENPEFTPGPKQCRYCKAATTCGPLAAFNMAQFGLTMEEVDMAIRKGDGPDIQDAKALTPEQRSWVLLHRKTFDRWMDNLLAEAKGDAAAGKPVPMMKRVPGRMGARAWSNESEARRALFRVLGSRRMYGKKMLSPTQVEDILGKKHFAELFGDMVYQSPAKPALVPITDGREAMATSVSKFAVIENGEE